VVTHDSYVTGVYTCALAISVPPSKAARRARRKESNTLPILDPTGHFQQRPERSPQHLDHWQTCRYQDQCHWLERSGSHRKALLRSEERRVGTECLSRARTDE